MDGILLIDKASGPSSFDVVRKTRRRAGVRRVGHAGTLDPLASGLLIVCLGQGTKLVPYLMDGDKRYTVTVALGEETDTLDSEGAVVQTAAVPPFTSADVAGVAAPFLGVISQVPPLYSAIKKGGEALYKKARRGEKVALEGRQIRIDAICVTAVEPDSFTLDVRCGKGTYIRSLARDMAQALGTVGHVTQLRRLASSGFDVANAHPLEMLEAPEWSLESHLVSLADAVPSMPKRVVSPDEARIVGYGQLLPPAASDEDDAADADTTVAVVDEAGRLLAISRRLESGDLKPVRGFPVTATNR